MRWSKERIILHTLCWYECMCTRISTLTHVHMRWVNIFCGKGHEKRPIIFQLWTMQIFLEQGTYLLNYCLRYTFIISDTILQEWDYNHHIFFYSCFHIDHHGFDIAVLYFIYQVCILQTFSPLSLAFSLCLEKFHYYSLSITGFWLPTIIISENCIMAHNVIHVNIIWESILMHWP